MDMKPNKGGRPAQPENQGFATIDMPTFTHANMAEVAYPGQWKLGYSRKAEALQATISNDFARGLIAPEYPSQDLPQEGSPLIKIVGKAFKAITYRSREDFEGFLQQCTHHYNGQADTPITVKTFKKDVIGLGFSIQVAAKTLTFDLEKWNENCYRVQASGVSNKVGSKPKMVKKAIAEIPPFFRDFGTTPATDVIRVIRTPVATPATASAEAATTNLESPPTAKSSKKRKQVVCPGETFVLASSAVESIASMQIPFMTTSAEFSQPDCEDDLEKPHEPERCCMYHLEGYWREQTCEFFEGKENLLDALEPHDASGPPAKRCCKLEDSNGKNEREGSVADLCSFDHFFA